MHVTHAPLRTPTGRKLKQAADTLAQRATVEGFWQQVVCVSGNLKAELSAVLPPLSIQQGMEDMEAVEGEVTALEREVSRVQVMHKEATAI